MKQNNSFHRSYDKMQNDIIEIKVDYRSWLRSLKVIGSSIAIILGILAYFGYDKIDTLESTILKQLNSRLAITDSLLSNIDEDKLDKLNIRLEEKEKEYNKTIANIARIIMLNKEIEDKILETLPNNSIIKQKYTTMYQSGNENIFEVKPIKKTYKQNSNEYFYLIFFENYSLENADFVLFQIQKGNSVLKDSFNKIESRFNKIELNFNIPKGKYIIEFGIVTKSNSTPTFHRVKKEIEII